MIDPKRITAAKAFLRRLIDVTPLEPPARWLWEIVNTPSAVELAGRRDEAFAFEIMSRILTKSSNCIDIGCYKGSFLSHIIHLAPQGHHYAFEPIPSFAGRLRKKFPGVNIIQVALSDISGEATFTHVLSRPGHSGLKKRSYPDPHEKTKIIKVQAERLDNILPLDYEVHFMKVDVEGAELQVFLGAIRTLRKYRPYIMFEHGQGASDYYGTTPEKVYELLADECRLNVNTLSDWLEGVSPLGQEEFSLIYKNGTACNFLAYPLY
jgi:FkbM family methyltransferase